VEKSQLRYWFRISPPDRSGRAGQKLALVGDRAGGRLQADCQNAARRRQLEKAQGDGAAAFRGNSPVGARGLKEAWSKGASR
jgi:hypothetical protein